jgi:HSP20 family protein
MATTLTRPEQKLETRREPFARLFDRDLRWMRQMTRDMERLFGDMGIRMPVMEQWPTAATWIPELEVFERDGRFTVRADLPGMKKEDVKVNVQDSMLILEGERRVEDDVKKDGFHRTERTYGSFFRSLPLPEGVKLDTIAATFKDGVLEIAMPIEKTLPATKNVEVKVG